MDLARLLLFAGAALMLAGAVVWALAHGGLGGRMPGDFVLRHRTWTAYFPLGTSLVVSVVLSVIATVLLRVFRR